jgi:hypothetical protein
MSDYATNRALTGVKIKSYVGSSGEWSQQQTQAAFRLGSGPAKRRWDTIPPDCPISNASILNMRFLTAVIIAALLGPQNTEPNVEQKTIPPYRAESSAYVIEGKDAWTYVTENRSFRFEEVLGDSGNYETLLLLEETYHNERKPGIEGANGTISVNAWTLKNGHQRELRWTLQARGNEGDVRDRLYRAIEWGCCDAPVVYSYYDILDGKKLYVTNSELLEVWFGEGPTNSRYIGFGYSVLDKKGQYPQLQYGTDKEVLQRFSLVSSAQYCEAPEVFLSTGTKLEKSLNLIGEPRSFSIVLKYPDGTQLQIPIEADAIRPEKAKLPKGYTLRLTN